MNTLNALNITTAKSLDELFGRVYFAAFQKNHHDFKFAVSEDVPLSRPWQVLLTVVLYFGIIYGIQAWLKNQEKGFAMRYPLIKNIIILHNFFLSAASFVLVMLLLENLVPKLRRHGLFYGICRGGIFDGQLELFFYLNYLLKYYELIDTLFLALSKKPLEFLHVYHHSATLVLCYSQLVGNTAVQWVPITINLWVHVIMYYYYGMTALGYQLWWKKYLTGFQIAQFVIDFFFVWYCIVTYYIFDFFLIPRGWWINDELWDCHGNWWSAWTGGIILSSYLLLFVDFFKKTYNEKRGRSHNATAKTKEH